MPRGRPRKYATQEEYTEAKRQRERIRSANRIHQQLPSQASVAAPSGSTPSVEQNIELTVNDDNFPTLPPSSAQPVQRRRQRVNEATDLLSRISFDLPGVSSSSRQTRSQSRATSETPSVSTRKVTASASPGLATSTVCLIPQIEEVTNTWVVEP